MRFWITILPLVVAPVLAYAYASREPAVYSATATVWFSNVDLGASLNGLPTNQELSQQPQIFATTQASIARAGEVARIAVKLAHVAISPQQLLNSSAASPESNADLLDFSVSNHDPALASRLATAYARAFTQYSTQLQTGPLQTALNAVTSRLAVLRAARSRGSLYTNLLLRQSQIVSLQVLQTSDTVLVKSAGAAIQTGPKTKRTALEGFGLGVLIALALVFVAEAVDNRVRGAVAIEAALNVPLIARVPPYASRGRKTPHAGLSMLGARASAQAEAFRMLRTSLTFASLKNELRTLLVTSARPDEGKTVTVANLGIAFALSGRDVIICDLDARKPSLGELFGYSQARPGVTDVVLSQTRLESALTKVELSGNMRSSVDSRVRGYGNSRGSGEVKVNGNLQVLPFGTFRPPDPGAFISSDALRDVVADLRKRAEIVIIDTAPLLLVSDALALSTGVDGILVVVRGTRATRGDLTEMRRILDASPAPVVGFVMTDVRAPDNAYGGAYGYSNRGTSALESISLETFESPIDVER